MNDYTIDIQELNERIEESSKFIDNIRRELSKVIVGQQYMIDRLLVGLLADGHVLLEGVPGLAKTLTVSSLAQVIDCNSRGSSLHPTCFLPI
jgi:MoxR-like ATPase